MKNTFDDIVGLYNYARPGYPQELFEEIITYSGINSSSRTLEVGAGTGQATTFFANHNYKITALEIGRKQVSYLTQKYKKYPNVCVNRQKFEDIPSDPRFDLIIAASSFHWIDETIRYKKAYAILNDRGTLAQFWHMHPVQKFSGGIFDEINAVYNIYFKGKKFYEDSDLRHLILKRMHQLTTYNFKDVSFYKYKYEHTYSVAEYTALLSTYSYVRSLADQKKEFLDCIYKCIEKQGGMIHIPTIIHLYLAKKM